MTTASLDDLRTQLRNNRIVSRQPTLSPNEAHEQWPLSLPAAQFVLSARQAISNVLVGADTRLLVAVGPCSIHSKQHALECGTWLRELSHKYADRMMVVMRACFEKPRSTVGWEGLLPDPHRDGSMDEEAGIGFAREIGLALAEIGMPIATEFVHTATPQYIDDLISLGWIGARTVACHNRRRMASGLSMPVGFKNAESGDIKPAAEAMKTADQRNTFRGLDDDGARASLDTAGNPDTFMILRGGFRGKNYEPAFVEEATSQLAKYELPARVVIDCAHGNSEKKPEYQRHALGSAVRQHVAGGPVMGFMLEATPDAHESQTDPCLGTADTEALLDWAYRELR